MAATLLDFPPLYTLQLNPATRQKQLSIWAGVIRDSLPGFSIQVSERPGVFSNKTIGRELDPAFITALCEYLVAEGLAEWTVPKQTVLVFKRPLTEWASAIHSWAVACGKTSSVESAFSIVAGDDSKGQAFHGIPNELMLKALQELESQHKCELIFRGDVQNDIMSCGVKFFP
jgi:ESCRT-II complex subunit VPS25